MPATSIQAPQRGQSEQARARAIIRFNGLMFHCLSAASFLESAAPLHVESLSSALAAQTEARLWLEQIWLPNRLDLGRRLREYVEATWPEFDWSAGYAEFHRPCEVRARVVSGRAGAALEVLACCVAETQAAVFYRALARAADEPTLRGLMREAASAHAGFFDYFRELFERRKRRERVGCAATWRMLRGACRAAREFHVRAAFDALAHNWSGQRTVPDLAYGEFVQRLAYLVGRHAALGRVERFLFRPWLAPERTAPAALPAPESRAPLFALQPA